jgi:isoleucyl-tRNA synthetase
MYPQFDESLIDHELEESMQLAQEISSTVLSLRKKENIKVRQPLSKIMIPVLNATTRKQIDHVAELIRSEVNVKDIEFISEDSGVITKKIKPNFKALGPKLGGDMKMVAAKISEFDQQQIAELERNGNIEIAASNKNFTISLEDVEIGSEDIPGWLVANAGHVTVALDVTITPELQAEGHAREFVSQLQRMRKEMQLEITDRVLVSYAGTSMELSAALVNYKHYICAEILADSLTQYDSLAASEKISINDLQIEVLIQKN